MCNRFVTSGLAFYSALLTLSQVQAQTGDVLTGRGPFTHADSLKGTYDAARAGSDVQQYYLDLRLRPETQTLEGSVDIRYQVTSDPSPTFRFELDTHLVVHQVQQVALDGSAVTGPLTWQREGPFYAVAVPQPGGPGSELRIRIHYGGRPAVAKNPPWNGGFTWAKDPAGNPWVSVSCQGEGASLWWPCKDHPADEPDAGVELTLTVPKGLVAVGNGRLMSTQDLDSLSRFTWRVTAPINLYAVNLTVARFAHLQGSYPSAVAADSLTLDHYVLAANATQARTHFGAQVPRMLRAFEHYFGPYPWYADGFKLVETPFWGMEHQSSIAYGNNYGYLPGWFPYPRKDLFDYIIVHEAGHEWFGNSLTHTDKADMWIHESFTTYSEALYVEYYHGPAEALRYLLAQRRMIGGTDAIQGPRGVAFEGWADSDMYFKGANVLHTLRTATQYADPAADSTQWFAALRALAQTYARQTLSTETVVGFFAQRYGDWVRPFFDQYLNYIALPVLEYKPLKRNTDGIPAIAYRVVAQAPGFKLPIEVQLGTTRKTLWATAEWQELPVDPEATPRFDDRNLLITLREVPGR
ncbi:MAG: M1 family metallopeptidase [Bacteroidia bacterium]|nr:M1 family metallopeptidase [Bacteroidia bacterium]